MKIKNWLFKTIAIILCVTSLSGCTQDNYDVSEAEKHKNNSEGSGFNLPSQYNREVNGIIFNIDQIEVADDIDLNNLFYLFSILSCRFVGWAYLPNKN